jgi:hypothetical protein
LKQQWYVLNSPCIFLFFELQLTPFLKLSKSEYQPNNVIAMTFRTLFSSFKQGHIHLGMRDYLNYGKGCFAAIFKARMDNAAKY